MRNLEKIEVEPHWALEKRDAFFQRTDLFYRLVLRIVVLLLDRQEELRHYREVLHTVREKSYFRLVDTLGYLLVLKVLDREILSKIIKIQ